MFSEKLRQAMQKLNLKQNQVVGLTGCSKASISQYLSGRNEPTDQKKCDIAASLGLDRNYFLTEDAEVVRASKPGRIKQMTVEQAAEMLQMNHNTVRKGLQQGVFPWGYGIHTSENRWVYFINAKRFAEVEGVAM